MTIRSVPRPHFGRILASILLASSGLVPLTAAIAADPPKLERVVMGTSGMGWLGFAGALDANGHVALNLPAGQLDDALKSLTVLPAGPGEVRLRQVTIGGRGVLANPFQDTPFEAHDLSSLSRLLDKLRGAAVVVEGDPPIEGRVIAVENRQVGKDGVAIDVPSLLLSTAAGLVVIGLDEERTVRLTDPEAQRILDTVLSRSAQTRSDERRVLDVVTDGAAGAALELGLLVQTPVWKPTWRLILGGQQARLQGWAVVENRTGQDWQDVQLTLVDGDAHTLQQELTRTWFVERPTVPVIPGPDIGPLALDEAPAQSPKFAALAATRSAGMAAEEAAASPAPLVEAEGTESGLTTTFAIEAPVDVADDGSLMVPLLDRPMQAERIAFVPPNGTGGAPESAIRLTNDTGRSLPSGIMTVMQEDAGTAPVHVGDAVLPAIPQSSDRRIAFGAERKINYTVDQDDTREVRTLALADGILTLTVAERQTHRWTFRSEDDQPRRLEATAWVPAGAVPVMPDDPRRDGDLWYVTGNLQPRGETVLDLVTERPLEERFVLSPDETLDTILASRGLTVPEAWKPRLAEIGALATRRADAERRLTQLAEERAGIVAEQERVRSNLESVSEAGPLRERWLGELAGQEDRLAEIEQERRQVVAERDQAAAALRAVVTELRR